MTKKLLTAALATMVVTATACGSSNTEATNPNTVRLEVLTSGLATTLHGIAEKVNAYQHEGLTVNATEVKSGDSTIAVQELVQGRTDAVFVNTESVAFRNVPSYYQVAASRPVDELLSPGTAALYRIGLGNLKLEPITREDADRAKRFADALIQQQQRVGLFGNTTIKIAFLGERLFRATLDFPANVPTGAYLVQIFLVRDHDVVGGQTTPLVVSKVGLDAALFDFASREAAAYGAIAVLTAVVAGWLASLPFRGV